MPKRTFGSCLKLRKGGANQPGSIGPRPVTLSGAQPTTAKAPGTSPSQKTINPPKSLDPPKYFHPPKSSSTRKTAHPPKTANPPKSANPSHSTRTPNSNDPPKSATLPRAQSTTAKATGIQGNAADMAGVYARGYSAGSTEGYERGLRSGGSETLAENNVNFQTAKAAETRLASGEGHIEAWESGYKSGFYARTREGARQYWVDREARMYKAEAEGDVSTFNALRYRG